MGVAKPLPDPVFNAEIRNSLEMADVARGKGATMLKRYGGDEQIHRSDLDGLAAQLRLEFAECPSSIRCQTGFRKLGEEFGDAVGVFDRAR